MRISTRSLAFRVVPLLAVLLALALPAQGRDGSGQGRAIHFQLFPFVSTSFLEIFPEDFTDPRSPLFGESLDGFLTRIQTTPPYVFPVLDPDTGDPVQPVGGNLSGEPVVVEIDGRIIVRIGALGRHDGPSVPLRFNGLIDNAEARRELAFFSDRVLLGLDGRPQHAFPIRYGRSDVHPKRDDLTHLVGLDIDGNPGNCAIADDPATPEDESVACDAENIPGPDQGADITREDWRPRSAVAPVTLGRFLDGGGFALVTPTRDPEVGRIQVVARGLIPGELYTIWEIDTDPLGRPLPQGFPLAGAPENVFKADARGRARFALPLIHNPIGASSAEVALGPGFPPVELPQAATIQVALVWHPNGQNNGGLSFSTDAGGGLPGG